MMEIEKLIARLKCPKIQRCPIDRIYPSCTACQKNVEMEAATTLEQFQAENDRLKRERDDAIRQLKFFAPCAGCKWYKGIKGCAHELGCDTNHDYYEFVAKEE